MAVRKILTYPDKFLKQPARQVKDIDESLNNLVDDMAETMYDAPGAGLAAIQIGSDKRILIYDIAPRDEKRRLHVLVNPRIVAKEGDILSENEGCLSVPDFRADVKRKAAIVVEGFDREGNPVRFDAEGYLAIVIQHEIDHLNGTLFIDHLSTLKRGLYTRRRKKQLAQK